MSKGGGGGSTTTVQKAEPPKYLLPFLQQAATAAQNLYQKGPQPLYPGQSYAPINATQKQGLNATLAAAKTPIRPYVTDSLNALQGAVNSTPGQNPYIDQMLKTYGQKANQLVASNFNASGRYGSGSHAATAGEAITNATAPYLFDQYNKDMTNKLQSAALLPGMSNAQTQQDLAKASAIGSVGDVYQNQKQNEINDAISKWQYEHGGGESDVLNNYIAQINNNPLSRLSSTSTTESKNLGTAGVLSNILGGANIGAGLGTSLGGSWLGSTFFPSAFTGGVGGILGALGGAFLGSDERLKENIKLVDMENGHNIYEFNYKNGSGKTYRGVLAQEVQKKNPDAVIVREDGFMAVDYGKIGITFKEVVGASDPHRAGADDSPGGRVELDAPASDDHVNRGL